LNRGSRRSLRRSRATRRDPKATAKKATATLYTSEFCPKGTTADSTIPIYVSATPRPGIGAAARRRPLRSSVLRSGVVQTLDNYRELKSRTVLVPVRDFNSL